MCAKYAVLQSRAMTKTDFLATLFGSNTRVKILRLLLSADEGACFTHDEIAKRTQVAKPSAQKELRLLEKIALVKKAKCMRTSTTGRGAKAKTVSKQVPGWIVNSAHPQRGALTAFLRAVSPLGADDIVERLRGVGRITLITIAGALVGDSAGRVDILVVGEHLDERKLQTALRSLEAEYGREVQYAAFSTEDFAYRMNVSDKLVRDIFDYPHETLLDTLDIATFFRS